MNAEDEVPLLKTSNKVQVLVVVGERAGWMLTLALVLSGAGLHPEGAEESPETAGRCV